VVEDERAAVRAGEANQADAVECLDRAGPRASDDERRLVGRLERLGDDLGRIRTVVARTTDSKARRPASATSAATATGRSRWMKRSRKNRKRNRSTDIRTPVAVMPRFGTDPSSTPASRVKEKVNVKASIASRTWSIRSQYQSRM
jgi:hypothetical protein